MTYLFNEMRIIEMKIKQLLMITCASLLTMNANSLPLIPDGVDCYDVVLDYPALDVTCYGNKTKSSIIDDQTYIDKIVFLANNSPELIELMNKTSTWRGMTDYSKEQAIINLNDDLFDMYLQMLVSNELSRYLDNEGK